MRRLSAALALAWMAVGAAVAQTIYRCDDGHGGVLYADAPCKDGAKVDVLPGKADPAAIERLTREQQAFDERQAVRDAKSRAEVDAAREERRVWVRRPLESDPQATYGGYPGYAWGGYWPWPPVPPRPPHPPRPEPTSTSSYVPSRPVLGMPSPPPAAPRR